MHNAKLHVEKVSQQREKLLLYLFMKRGNKTDHSNHRGISNSSPLYKIIYFSLKYNLMHRTSVMDSHIMDNYY